MAKNIPMPESTMDEGPNDPNYIDMNAGKVPVTPDAAALECGYVAQNMRKSWPEGWYSEYADSQEDASRVGGFLRRNNFSERS